MTVWGRAANGLRRVVYEAMPATTASTALSATVAGRAVSAWKSGEGVAHHPCRYAL